MEAQLRQHLTEQVKPWRKSGGWRGGVYLRQTGEDEVRILISLIFVIKMKTLQGSDR